MEIKLDEFFRYERENEASPYIPKPISPLDRQVGGDHYKNLPIQPVEYIRKNKLGWFEGNVVKYVSRHRFKNKRQDIEKAIHMLECILKEYDDGDLD